MINKSHELIVEELHACHSGKILEQVNRKVISAIDRFFKEQKTPSRVKDRINNILNFIYLRSNEFGNNTFVGGTADYTKGDVVDYGGPESGPDPQMFPSIYEVNFEVRFDNARQDFDKFYNELSKKLQKEMKKNFNDYEQDAFSINIGIDCKMDDMFGYSISIEKSSRGLKICVFNQVDPFIGESVNEAGHSAVKTIKYFKGQKPWDRFRFEFIPWRNREGKMFLKVNMENEYWDSSDYAFIDIDNPEVTNIHSYSKEASDTVLKALKAAGYKKSSLSSIIKELKINPIPESSDIDDKPYVAKRKDIESDEKSGSDEDKNEKDDSDESSTGVFGQEIGLPIDKENCESTDVSGVSTPTGTLNPVKKKGITEGIDSEDTKDMTIQCPECGSQLITVRDADIFHCTDCGYEWEIESDNDGDEKERIQRDSMLDNTNDEDPLPKNLVNDPISNIYTNPQSDSRLHESVTSASDLKEDLYKAVSQLGEISYNGSDFIEVESDTKDVKSAINKLESVLKKRYKTSKANNRLSVDGGDEFHYIEITVKPKAGNNGIFVIDYDIPV